MKTLVKLSIVTCFLFILNNELIAQAGIRGGLNASNLSVEDFDDRKTRYGFNISLFTHRQITGPLYISPEIGFSTKGSSVTYKSSNTTNSFNLNYAEFDLPLTIRLAGVDIQVGPYVSYLINANAKTQNNSTSVTTELNRDNFNRIDAGGILGITLNLGNIGIGARYGLGFVDIAKTNTAKVALGDAHNSVGQLSVSFMF